MGAESYLEHVFFEPIFSSRRCIRVAQRPRASRHSNHKRPAVTPGLWAVLYDLGFAQLCMFTHYAWPLSLIKEAWLGAHCLFTIPARSRTFKNVAQPCCVFNLQIKLRKLHGFAKSETKPENDLAPIKFNAPYPVSNYATKVIWLLLYLKNCIFWPPLHNLKTVRTLCLNLLLRRWWFAHCLLYLSALFVRRLISEQFGPTCLYLYFCVNHSVNSSYYFYVLGCWSYYDIGRLIIIKSMWLARIWRSIRLQAKG